MIFFFSLILFTLLYQAFLNTASAILHWQNALLLTAPIIIVMVIFSSKIIQGLFFFLCAGVLLDSLTGGILGPNMIAMVFIGTVAMSFSAWLGQPHWPLVFSFLLSISLFYRLFLIQTGNWSWQTLTVGPLADACIGVILLSFLPKRILNMD